MDFEEWLNYGIEQGWCGPTICYTHDGLPMTEGEDSAFSEGDDPCMHIVRLYEDEQVKNEVESWHSPSVWRGFNT